jgi:PAS domain S-box-containing protein
LGAAISNRFKSRLTSWPVLAAIVVLAQALFSLTVSEGHAWIGITNAILISLLLLTMGIAGWNAARSTQTVRLFWAFFAGACGLWALNPAIWMYSVAIRGQALPEIWPTSLALFLHIVLLIAAVLLSPHLKSASQKPYRATLNFLLLLLFWVFVYAFFMYPYLFGPETAAVVMRFEAFYLLENLLLLLVLARLITRSAPPWRTIYRHLLGASSLYAFGSVAGNIRIALSHSSAGPIYIPYIATACWFLAVTVQGWRLSPLLEQTVRVDDRETRYSSVLAMLAVVAIPLVGIWELLWSGDTAETRAGRLLIVLIFAVLLAMVLFVRENLANRELSSDAVQANDRLRLAMESGKTVGWHWDMRSDRDMWFGDLKTMFGLDADTHVGQLEHLRRRIHAEDRELMWSAVEEARQSHKPYRAEFRVVREDGTVRWVMASGKFYYSSNGTPLRMLGIAHDITERKQAEDALRESEERFRLVANTAPVMIWMAGPDKLRNYLNRPWLEFTGRPADAELGSGWTTGMHPEDLEQSLETFSQSFEKRELFRMEYRLRRHDGEFRWVLDTGVPRFTPEGSFAGYIGSCVDVTDHKLAEEALSGLNRKLIEAHEEERTWIARELHDDICQRMSLLTIQLERLGQVVLNASEMRIRVNELCRRVMDLGKDVQRISHRLHSSKLEHLGIAAAAAGFCKELAEQQKVEIDFRFSGVPSDLPREVSLCLFRVLQEALHNAVKHAGVRNFIVELHGSSQDIQLEVIDRGSGFDAEAAMKNHGLGLISMQERLNLVKGEMSIQSQPGSGTRVCARIPLSSGERLAELVG